MKRKLLAAVLTALLALTMVVPCALAKTQDPGAEPCSARVTPSLTFTGNTANCSVSIVYLGKSINATLELWQGNTRLASWSDSAVSRLSISEEYPVVSGRTYTLKVSGTAGGSPISAAPVTGTCP